MNTKNILIVDDDVIDRKYLERYCSKRGFEYLSVSDGEEAIKEIKSNERKFQVVLSDIDMPNRNGFELIKWIRSSFKPNKKNILVVAISANESTELKEYYTRIGFDFFLPKPADLKLLDHILHIQNPPPFKG